MSRTFKSSKTPLHRTYSGEVFFACRAIEHFGSFHETGFEYFATHTCVDEYLAGIWLNPIAKHHAKRGNWNAYLRACREPRWDYECLAPCKELTVKSKRKWRRHHARALKTLGAEDYCEMRYPKLRSITGRHM